MGQVPSPLELMLFADGELHGQRRIEVEAWLAGNRHAQAKIATVHEMGAVVREATDQRAACWGADAIADLVMSRLDESPSSEPAVKVGAISVSRLRRTVMRDLRPPTTHRRFIAPLAIASTGFAMAAAVALVVWHFAGMGVHALTQVPSAVVMPSEPGALVASAGPIVPPEVEEAEPGVSVDLIEFGAHAGTIFYVPTGTGTTTVVWLTDDEPGGSKE